MVQVIHQTIHEFFLDPKGYTAESGFRVYKKDAYIYISRTYTRYLMLYAADTTLAKTLPPIKSWTSDHFILYTQYLDKRPLANYALCYLKHRIGGYHRDTKIDSTSVGKWQV